MPRHTSQTTEFLGMFLPAAAALGQSSPSGAEDMRCSLVPLFLSIPVSAVNPYPRSVSTIRRFRLQPQIFPVRNDQICHAFAL
jgi:hypothetical protein